MYTNLHLYISQRLAQQIAFPQSESVTFAESPQIQQIIEIRRFADVRICNLQNLFADRPSL
jgi:hypothetical protein